MFGCAAARGVTWAAVAWLAALVGARSITSDVYSQSTRKTAQDLRTCPTVWKPHTHHAPFTGGDGGVKTILTKRQGGQDSK